jgi:hypothetical protein
MRRLLVGLLVAALVLSSAAAAVGADAAEKPATPAAKWRLETTPNQPGSTVSDLSSVSCSSAFMCTAVGNWAHSLSTPEHNLADRWRNGRWTIPPIPHPAGAAGSGLYSISCVSDSACTAVGNYGKKGAGVAFAENWNGTNWSLETPAEATSSALLGISCSSATTCEAVGDSGNAAFAEVWNGTKWRVQRVPKLAGVALTRFYSVSCTSTRACTAVGYRSSPHNARALAERWDGASWSLEKTPSPADATLTAFSGVSCYLPEACTAAGTYTASDGAQQTLSEAWNGSRWKIQSTPNPAGTVTGGFSSVSCTAAGACIAVGSYTLGNTAPPIPLAEKRSGGKWSLQSLPPPSGATSGALFGVSCTGPAACTAVGYYTSSSGVFTLAERYS